VSPATVERDRRLWTSAHAQLVSTLTLQKTKNSENKQARANKNVNTQKAAKDKDSLTF